MAQVDKLLQRLNNRVNKDTMILDVTLFVGGAMITGKIVPYANWLDANIRALTGSAADPFAEDFAQAGATSDSDEYLHLTQGKSVHGTVMVPSHGGAMRIALADVQGWMIGRLEAEPSS